MINALQQTVFQSKFIGPGYLAVHIRRDTRCTRVVISAEINAVVDRLYKHAHTWSHTRDKIIPMIQVRDPHADVCRI